MNYSKENYVNDYDRLFKVLITGNSSVGKTNMLLRFATDNFDEGTMPTVGIDFKAKSIDIDGRVLRLAIWDTAGQERYKTIIPAYFKQCHAVIFAYDITDRSSFENVEYWMAEAKRYAELNYVRMLIGNKSDLEGERQVSIEEGAAFAELHDIPFFEVSAKYGANVNEFFTLLAKMMDEIPAEEIDNNNNGKSPVSVAIEKKTKKNKDCC